MYETHPYPGKRIWDGPWDDCFGYLTNDHPVFAGEWEFEPGSPDANLDATAQLGQGVSLFGDQLTVKSTLCLCVFA